MKIKKIEVIEFEVDFKNSFSHAKYTRRVSRNILIKIHSDNFTGVGECLPREYVTGESLEDCKKNIATLSRDFSNIEFNSIEEVIDYIIIYYKNLERTKIAAFSGFENALINLSCIIFQKSIKDVLYYMGQEKSQKKRYYTGPISEPKSILSYFSALKIKLFRFRDIKIKVSPSSFERALSLKKIFFKNNNVIFDANGSLENNMMSYYLDICTKNNIRLEQPLDIKSMFSYFKNSPSNCCIVYDESVCTYSEVKSLINIRGLVIIGNIRIAKNGGIIPTILTYKLIKAKNKEITLGCLVGETVSSRYTTLLGKYLNCISYEGGYDIFLFKKNITSSVIMEPPGLLKETFFDLNQKIQIKLLPEQIKEQYYLTNGRKIRNNSSCN